MADDDVNIKLKKVSGKLFVNLTELCSVVEKRDFCSNEVYIVCIM